MTRRFPQARRDSLAVAGIALALALFVSLNLLAGTMLGRARLDLTEDDLHTLSEGTRKTLADIEEPITLRLYMSEGLREASPRLADHARRVRELLRHYVHLADGRIDLDILRPAPYSPEEDQALADGLQAMRPGPDTPGLYFGLAGTNSTDDSETIPLFTAERADFLEYDLTRLVHALAHPRQPVVAVLGALPLGGDMARGEQPWRIMELMRRDYRVRTLGHQARRIDPDVDVLLLAQPAGLEPATRYAVQRYLRGGGKILAFVDPFAEVLGYRRREAAGPPPAARLDDAAGRLLAGWGVRMDPQHVVADRAHARQVRTRAGGRETVVDYVGWLALPGAALAGDDAVTANLSQLALKSAGAIAPLPDAPTRLTALARSSPRSMPLAVDTVAGFPDPARLLADFAPGDSRYLLAARIDGPFPDTFPDGPPEGAATQGHRSGGGGGHVILVADADMLADDAWVRVREAGGETVATPYADNGDFVINALDNLSGGGELIALRGRGPRERPFTLIERMRQAAESKYRSREQALIRRIAEGRDRIRELRQRERQTGVVMSAEQRQEVATLRQDLVRARRELREVRHNLHEDVERVRTLVRAANIWGMPALVALLALGLAAIRRARRRRAPVPG